ncbi:Hypothetical protein SRAE_X000256900 [Strongyloides ratti]|uniref:Uncharacterized protein n=1 Tax=Strongyloides ratti TaxID=34506 RepID=A0A090KY91_STRRB|nr:Hypothetical protein SRAE_X000256900 [Strongyloides ratti]CEF60837.1 Hypothetical protein SRAE_X000256900 [Strongyloides ratti]
MHFIKYLAIFAIFAIQFSLQDVSSEEDSNQVAVASQEGNNLSVKQTQIQKKNLLGSLKDKLGEKTKELKAKVGQAKDKVKLTLENTKNEVKEKLNKSPKFKKTLEVKNKLKTKASNFGNKLKTKISKLF